MQNAKVELIYHVGKREVEYVKVLLEGKLIEGSLDDVIDKLDFSYDNGPGGQEMFGYIWYKDGTWSEREEYDGLEWWRHVERPSHDVEITNY
jgi:hypothetical protein